MGNGEAQIKILFWITHSRSFSVRTTVEFTLSKQVSLSWFAHIGTTIPLSVMWKRRCFECSQGPGLWRHTTYPPQHSRNAAGARRGADVPFHINPTSASRHRKSHTWDTTAAALIIAGRKISTTILCLFTKSRHYGSTAALFFAMSQLDCVAGICCSKREKNLFLTDIKS